MSFDQDRPQPSHDQSFPRPLDTTAGRDLTGPSTGGSGLSDDGVRRLDAALHSQFGIDKLLNRLKQSIFSAREFSSFLRERSTLEERYGHGYKKLVRNAGDSMRRAEARQGSYAKNFDESLRINDRLAENSIHFASSLQSMSDELREMAENVEKGRKHWKHTAMDAEKKVNEAENAQSKAKDRYNNAAEQYERVRTGEKQGGKFGLKNKSPAQQEEALKEKADMLDQEYASKLQLAQAERRDYENTHKPQIVRALRDLITECDAALGMHMARLASVSEKHLVSNGMAIAPIKPQDATGPEPRGLRQIASEIDDRKDFHDYILDGPEPPPQFKGRSRRNTDAELVNTPMQSTANFDRPQAFDSPYNGDQHAPESHPPQLPHLGNQDSFGRSFEMERPAPQTQTSYNAGQPETLSRPMFPQPQQTGIIQDMQPSTGAGRGIPPGPSLPAYDRAAPPQIPPAYGDSQSTDLQPAQRRDSGGPMMTRNPDNAGPFIGRGGPAPGSYMDPGKSAAPYGVARGQDATLAQRNLPSQQPPRPMLPPLRPVFGVHLDELFRRDGSAVPAIVFQCIRAVDLHGMNTEGIYRVSGSVPTVVQLKSEFDHDSSKVDLTEREAFNGDISAVATLLKNFLRDLPDSLLTNANYAAFIQAAKYEDAIQRRDALHQYINSLPDPNYATLRVLVLHLHRVATNHDVNKMDMRNLSIVFGPTVMGGTNVADAGWQKKVMETILQHTHDIFDPDD